MSEVIDQTTTFRGRDLPGTFMPFDEDTKPKGKYESRILGIGIKAAAQFTFNPDNPRHHPQEQRDAIEGSLTDIGWVDVVIENFQTGYLIDGHDRVFQALNASEEEPVTYILVDVPPEQEAQILLTFDYTGSMATFLKDKMVALMARVKSENSQIRVLLGRISERERLHKFAPPPISSGNARPLGMGERYSDGGEGVSNTDARPGASQAPDLGSSAPEEDYSPTSEIPETTIRQIQLFYDIPQLEEFNAILKFFRERIQADNPSDAILEIMRYARDCRQASDDG